jgi:snurportin-1
VAWRGQQLHECTAEFRRFWLDGTVREDLAAGAAALAARRGCVPAAEAAAAAEQQQQQDAGAPAGAAADEAMQDAPGAAAAGAAGPEAAAAAAAAAAGAAAAAAEPGPVVTYPFEVVPAARCTPEGLLAAYQQPVPYRRDGLYLLHCEGRYQQGSPSPLALTWKDAACSSYYIDTDARGVVPEHQQVTLVLQLDGGVATHDEAPLVLGRMPAQFMAGGGGGGRPGGGARVPAGRLLRFTIRADGITFHEGRPAGADLHYEGPANQRKGRADLISKVMFQYNARRQPVAVQELLEVAAAGAAGAGGMAEDGPGGGA